MPCKGMAVAVFEPNTSKIAAKKVSLAIAFAPRNKFPFAKSL